MGRKCSWGEVGELQQAQKWWRASRVSSTGQGILLCYDESPRLLVHFKMERILIYIYIFLIEFSGLVKVCFLPIGKVSVTAMMRYCHDFIKSYQAK